MQFNNGSGLILNDVCISGYSAPYAFNNVSGVEMNSRSRGDPRFLLMTSTYWFLRQ